LSPIEKRRPTVSRRPPPPAWPVFAVSAWVALAAAGSEGLRAQTPPPAPAPAEKTVDAAEPAASTAAMSRNLWWNQPRVVELLALSEAQRAAMDRVFADYLAARRRARQERRERPGEADPFHAAVAAADLEAARRAVEENGERIAAEVTSGQRMMLAVLELLDAGQLDKVRTEVPELLSRRWFLQAGGEGPRRRPPVRRPPRPGAAGADGQTPPAADPPPGGSVGGGD
jgi:hypothetical protein